MRVRGNHLGGHRRGEHMYSGPGAVADRAAPGAARSDRPGAPATAPGRWWSEPYLWVAVLVCAALAPVCVYLPWGGDLGIHLATVGRLRHSLSDPGNPMLAEDTPSAYYSPWTVALALLGRATGWSTMHVLGAGALFALPLLLLGVYRFTRALTPARWAPVAALLCFTLLWGDTPWSWSGFMSLVSWIQSLPYPSTVAWGIAFNLLAFVPGVQRRGWRIGESLLLGGGSAVLLLVHQFTGALAMVALAAFVAADWRAMDRSSRLRLGAGAALMLLVLALWPYYSVFQLSDQATLDSMHHALYRMLPVKVGLAALGLPALYARRRRQRLDPLVLLFAVCALAFGYGYGSGHYSYGRFEPGVMLPLQFALAIEVTERWQQGWVRFALVPLTTAALLAGAAAQWTALGYVHQAASALVHRRSAARYQADTGLAWITRYTRPGQVVMTDYPGWVLAPAYGRYVVASPYPDPFVKDEGARIAATLAFFNCTTTQSRLATLAAYHADWVIAPRALGLTDSPYLHKVANAPGWTELFRVTLPARAGGAGAAKTGTGTGTLRRPG